MRGGQQRDGENREPGTGMKLEVVDLGEVTALRGTRGKIPRDVDLAAMAIRGS